MIYCLALIAPIGPATAFLGSEWIASNTSGSAWPAYRIVAVLLVLARFVFVMARPRALQAYVAAPLFRSLSIAAMTVGLILAVSSFFAKPITLWLFGRSDGAGVVFLVVVGVLSQGAYLATLGVVVFELTRAIGEMKAAFARVTDRWRSRGR
jgi:O-antigen/teichoic acid export membrane protein